MRIPPPVLIESMEVLIYLKFKFKTTNPDPGHPVANDGSVN